MGGLVGQSNVARPKMPALFEPFNEYLVGSTLAVVDEAAETSDKRSKYVALDSLRDQLTESPFRLNEKHEKARTDEVFTNFLFLSNNEDALVIQDEKDRRIFVIISDEQPRSAEYYARLWSLVVQPDVLGRVAAWLKPYAAEAYPNRAPMNESKKRLMDASTPEWVHGLREVIAGKDELSQDDLSGSWANGVSNGHLSHVLRREGFHPARRTANGERYRVWVRSNSVVVPLK